MSKLILASASPRRTELLKQINLEFEVLPSDVDENLENMSGEPHEKAMELALSKAKDISEKRDSGIIIGADTIVVLGSEIFGKPKDDQDAFEMLSRLSGREHQVITGVALINVETGETIVEHESTVVSFLELTKAQIDSYIRTKEPFGKAGAYGIQGIGSLLVEKIEGCYFNVVGLPINRLSRMLRKFGVEALK